jgi:hypothetical protein
MATEVFPLIFDEEPFPTKDPLVVFADPNQTERIFTVRQYKLSQNFCGLTGLTLGMTVNEALAAATGMDFFAMRIHSIDGRTRLVIILQVTKMGTAFPPAVDMEVAIFAEGESLDSTLLVGDQTVVDLLGPVTPVDLCTYLSTVVANAGVIPPGDRTIFDVQSTDSLVRTRLALAVQTH